MGLAETAVRVFACVESLSEEAGVLFDVGDLERKEATIAGARAQLDDAGFAAAEAAGRAMTMEEATQLVLSLDGSRG